jgi:hypothetical protein
MVGTPLKSNSAIIPEDCSMEKSGQNTSDIQEEGIEPVQRTAVTLYPVMNSATIPEDCSMERSEQNAANLQEEGVDMPVTGHIIRLKQNANILSQDSVMGSREHCYVEKLGHCEVDLPEIDACKKSGHIFQKRT